MRYVFAAALALLAVGLALWLARDPAQELPPPTGADTAATEARPRGAARDGGGAVAEVADPEDAAPSATTATPVAVESPESAVPVAFVEIGHVGVGRGLVGDRGATPSLVELELRGLERETQLRLRVEPPDAIEADDLAPVSVPPRRRATLLTLDHARAGTADVWVQRTELDGQPLGDPAHVRLAPEPVTVGGGPELVAARIATPGPGVARATRSRVVGIAGLPLGRLEWLRAPFEGDDERETRIDVVADDPRGILSGLPRFVVVPAGASSVESEEEVQLRDVEGEAVLRLRWDGRETELRIESVRPTWRLHSCPTRVPVGARFDVVAVQDRRWSEERTARLTIRGSGVLELQGASERSVTAPRDSASFRLLATASGRATIRLAAPRLDPLEQEVEVTGPRVRVVGDELRVTGDVWAAGGTLRVEPVGEGTLRPKPETPRTGVSPHGRGVRIDLGAAAPEGGGELVVGVRLESSVDGTASFRVVEEPTDGAAAAYVVEHAR